MRLQCIQPNAECLRRAKTHRRTSAVGESLPGYDCRGGIRIKVVPDYGTRAAKARGRAGRRCNHPLARGVLFSDSRPVWGWHGSHDTRGHHQHQSTPPIYYVRGCKYALFARKYRRARSFAEISKLASANRVQRCAKFGTGETRGGALGFLANRSIKPTFYQGFLGNLSTRPTRLLVLYYITFLYEK